LAQSRQHHLLGKHHLVTKLEEAELNSILKQQMLTVLQAVLLLVNSIPYLPCLNTKIRVMKN
jgi:Fe2+ transport system protein B